MPEKDEVCQCKEHLKEIFADGVKDADLKGLGIAQSEFLVSTSVN